MLTVGKNVYQSRNILILASLSTHIPVHRIPAKSVCVCHKRKTFQTLQRNMSITFNKAANCVQRSTHVTDEWKMNLIALCWVSTFLKWVRICIADQKHIQSAGRVTFLGLGACWQRFYDSNSSKNVELWPPHKLTHISINLKSIFIWMANILCANQSVLKGGFESTSDSNSDSNCEPKSKSVFLSFAGETAKSNIMKSVWSFIV